jgi:hypothetical protein
VTLPTCLAVGSGGREDHVMNDHDSDGALVPLAASGEPDMARLAGQLVEAASERGIELTGADGLLTALTRQVLQSALEAEMEPAPPSGSPCSKRQSSMASASTPSAVAIAHGGHPASVAD